MSEKKKVIVFTTGGTIAMKFDPKVNGLVPAVSGADLAAAVPGLDKLADVEVRVFKSCQLRDDSAKNVSALSND